MQNYSGNDPWSQFFTDLKELPPEIAVLGINDYLFVDGYERVLNEHKSGNLPNIEAVFPVVELRLSRFAGSDGKLRRINWHIIFREGFPADTIRGQFINGLSARYKLEPGATAVWSGLVSRENLEDLGKHIRSTIPPERLHQFNETNLELGFNNLNIDVESLRSLLEVPALAGNFLTAIGRAEWASLQWNDQSIASKKDLINDADIVFTAAPTIDSYHKGRAKLREEGLNDHLLDCSDAHTNTSNTATLNRLGQTFTWINADPTLDGLRRALVEFDTRIHVGTEPEKLSALRLSGADHARTLKIEPSIDNDDSEPFFNLELDLNPGFVAIIGNKGKGKSALLDALGLTANSYEQSNFSFLRSERFLDPRTRYGNQYVATLQWHDGTKSSRKLGAQIQRDAPENATYLPQRLLDDICSSDPTGQLSAFSTRLSSVLFAHVPHENRLDTTDLESLIGKRTTAIDEQVAVYRGELSRINAEIATLVRRHQPDRLQKLRTDLEDAERRVRDLNALKPVEVAAPADTTDPQSAKIRADVDQLRIKRTNLTTALDKLRAEEAQLASKADSLSQVTTAVETLQGTIGNFFANNESRAAAANVDLGRIIRFEIDTTSLVEAKAALNGRREQIASDLDPGRPESQIAALRRTEQDIIDLEDALDEPARDFAEYQSAVARWNEALDHALRGGDGQVGKADIESAIAEFGIIPAQLAELSKARTAKSRQIHESLVAKITILNELYGPARSFIARHELAVSSGLEFAAALGLSSFDERFWELIGRNVAGPFFGQVEGSEKLKEMLSTVAFDDADCVATFTEAVCDTISKKQGGSYLDPERYLRKGRTLEEFYDFLFGLDYIEPYHLLRYQGVPLERLSPGEKGTLLLMFYLLIDPSRKPILLDQPDENLDNKTIKDLLAPAIKEASRRRQVVIVTHNANVAVVADADQIIVANQENGHFSYLTGSIEDPDMNQNIVDVLEGTWPAFGNRESKYQRPDAGGRPGTGNMPADLRHVGSIERAQEDTTNTKLSAPFSSSTTNS